MKKNTYNNSTIKYFDIGNNQVIYPASTFKRFGARFFDIFIAILTGRIITSVYLSGIPKVTSEAINVVSTNPSSWATVIEEFLPSSSEMLVLSSILTIVLLFVFLIFIPLLNRKNVGQTFGKWMIGITPIYLNKRKSEISFLIRELPFVLFLIFPSIFRILAGIDAAYYYAVFTNLTKLQGDFINVGLFDFFTNYLPNIEGIKDSAPSFAYAHVSFIYIAWIMLILIWISIAVNPQKKGLLDEIPNTSVVDLRTKTKKSDAINMHQKFLDLENSKIPPSQNAPGPTYEQDTQSYQKPSETIQNQSPYVTPVSEEEHLKIEEAKKEAREKNNTSKSKETTKTDKDLRK